MFDISNESVLDFPRVTFASIDFSQAVRPGDSSPRFEESGNIEGKASDVVGGASATLELDQHVSEVEQQQARSSASMSPRVEGRRPRDEAARR